MTLLREQDRIAAFNLALLAMKRRFAVPTKALHGEN
jgi:hypothetical protein